MVERAHGPECWSPPVIQDGEAKIGPGDPQRRLVVGANGSWTNCDVYVKVPEAWVDNVTLDLELQQFDDRVRVDEALISDADFPRITGGWYSGRVLSMRGRPFMGRVDVGATPSNAEALGTGFVYLNLWGREGASETDRAGQQVVMPFARRAQELQFSGTLLAGENTIFAAQANRKIYVTSASYTTDDAARRLLRMRSALGVGRVDRRQWVPSAAFPIVEHFTYPLRAQRGAAWIADLDVLAGVNRFNATGFVE